MATQCGHAFAICGSVAKCKCKNGKQAAAILLGTRTEKGEIIAIYHIFSHHRAGEGLWAWRSGFANRREQWGALQERFQWWENS